MGFLQFNFLLFFWKKDIICIKSCIGVHVVKFQNNYKTNGPAHSLILWIICQRIKRDRKQEKINSVWSLEIYKNKFVWYAIS